jgi:hypothetical protein
MKIDLSENDYNFIINLLKINYKVSEIIERMNENPKDFGNIKEMALTINKIKELDKDKLLYLIKVFESVRK